MSKAENDERSSMKRILLYTSLAWMACFSWIALPALSTAATAQAPCGAAVSQYDPNPGNNCDSATTEVLPPPTDQGVDPDDPGGGSSPGVSPTFPGFPANPSNATTSAPDAITTSVPAGDSGVASTGTVPSRDVPVEESGPHAAAPSATASAPIPAPTVEPSAGPATTTEQPAAGTAGAAPPAVASSAVAPSASSAPPARRMVLPDTGGPAAFLISSGTFVLAAGFLMRRLLRSR